MLKIYICQYFFMNKQDLSPNKKKKRNSKFLEGGKQKIKKP